jgi:hypothetical protein
MSKALVPYEAIEKKIYQIRDKRVMLDKDLAEIYEVDTRQLTRQVRRNIDRFPEDFMFQLTREEFDNLMCQFGTSSLTPRSAASKWGGTRKLPFAFTELGVAMLSSVLKSRRAVQANIQIMRVFINLRHQLVNNKELAGKIELLEKRVFKHDADIRELVRDIRKMTIERPTGKHNVGFLK